VVVDDRAATVATQTATPPIVIAAQLVRIDEVDIMKPIRRRVTSGSNLGRQRPGQRCILDPSDMEVWG
jgi:hypothetical protein